MSFSCPAAVLPDPGEKRISVPADHAGSSERSNNALSPAMNANSSEIPGHTRPYVADPHAPHNYYDAGILHDANEASSMALSTAGANQVDVDVSLFRRKDADEVSVTTRISNNADSFKEKDGDYYKSVGATQSVLFDLFGLDRSSSKQQQEQHRFQDDTMIVEDLSTKYSTMLLCPFQIAGRYPRPGMHAEHEHWYDLIATEAQVRF